jgi:hypothetical protein
LALSRRQPMSAFKGEADMTLIGCHFNLAQSRRSAMT